MSTLLYNFSVVITQLSYKCHIISYNAFVKLSLNNKSTRRRRQMSFEIDLRRESPSIDPVKGTRALCVSPVKIPAAQTRRRIGGVDDGGINADVTMPPPSVIDRVAR